MKEITFSERVLNWYDTNQRVLPWRDNKNPYYIWVSEIMLQQTKVQAVIPYFERFIKEIPNVASLAKTDDELLLKLWEGLGYYNRVRNMKKAAIDIMERFNGVVPSNKEELESLSGIGAYTSGAVTSIAFENRVTAIDGNVLRVFARLHEIKKSIKDKEVKKQIKHLVEDVLPFDRIGDFNQGLMEIGATICLPNGRPKCETCPMNDICLSYRNNTMMSIPIKNKKKPVPKHKKTILLINYKDKYAIEQRPNTGLLQSMYQFPLLDNHLSQNDILELLNITDCHIEHIGSASHKFTHLEWDMIGYRITIDNIIEDYQFLSIKEILEEVPIPNAFKIFKSMIKEETYE